MIKYRLAQFTNPILKMFGYQIIRMAEINDDLEIIFHPWQLKKLKK